MVNLKNCKDGIGLSWQSIGTAPEKKVVWTKIDDGNGPRNESQLIRQGGLWFFPDLSMYVYYAPTHWRSVDGS